MQKALLDTAMQLMQQGVIPSVSDVAEAAEVSRATAYRYFPSQAAMIQDAVDEALGPILDWSSDSTDAEERLADLLAFAYPRMSRYEATLRGALLLAIDQWTRRHAGTLGDEAPIVRGHRIDLLADALRPLRGRLGRTEFDKLAQSLSLIFGTEAFVVLKDIWGLGDARAREVAIWAGHALIRGALADAGRRGRNGSVRGAGGKAARDVRRRAGKTTSNN
jgi:AcrR family transcriptional regulator